MNFLLGLFILVSMSDLAVARTSPGVECLKLLTSRMASTNNEAIASALKCKNQYSVRAMDALTRLRAITNSAVSTASKVESEEGALCFEALSKMPSVTDEAFKMCLLLPEQDLK